MATPLGLGVVGLGRRWQGYRLALEGMRRRFRVVAVCDPSAARAQREARALGCAAAGGVGDLLERDGVDGVLVLDTGWQGLWPADQAVRAGRPVLCAAPLAGQGVDSLAAGRVQMALAPRLAQGVARLRALLEDDLGPARLVRADWACGRRADRAVLDGPFAVPLLQACASLLDGPPARVTATHAPDFAALTLEFDEGVAHVTGWQGDGAAPGWRLTVEAAEGTASVTPGELRWTTAEGDHRLRPGAELPEWGELLRFAAVVRGQAEPVPGVPETLAALGWLRAASPAREGL